MTRIELLNFGTNILNRFKIKESRLDSELILCKALSLKKLQLYMSFKKLVSLYEFLIFGNYLRRRIKFEPISYILGYKEFIGYIFKVDKRALIPRPETEILVESCLSLIKSNPKEYKIVDVGTGCGNMAISLAKNLNNVKIYATDISLETLELARENAKLNNVNEKIVFLCGNLLEPLHKKEKFNFIISNPPYIKAEEINNLPREVRKFEPNIALNGGNDGLKFYKEIIRTALKLLEDGGYLAFEIGFAQIDKVKKLFDKSGQFTIINVIKDYSGIDRVIIAERKWRK
ncbi:MAG: peptide chain release factor N(5)-glutamine methyltransferase [Candidatus Firestonebacteria bacterium]